MYKWDYLQYSPEDRKAILNSYNRNENDLLQDIKIVQDWIESQPHLPKLLGDEKVEKFLLLNKFSIEKTKQKIDMYFSIRSIFPETYEEKGPLSKPIPKCGKDYQWVILPNLDGNKNRILLFSFQNQNSDNFDLLRVLGYALCVAEIRLRFEMCASDIVLFDLKNLTFGHLAKTTPTVLKQVITVSEEVFSMRIKALYFIHTSTLMDKLITILKSLLKPKIAKRMQTFATLDDLYEVVPKKLMPKDYGGNEPSTSELIEVWDTKIQEYSDWFDLLRNNPVDEKLRPGKPLNDDFLGYHGNFKKLNVD